VNSGAIILAIGAAGAIYIWYRSQQAQAAALAAAQSAPGPGLIAKAGNTLRGVVGAVPQVASGIGSTIEHVAVDAATLDFLQHGTPLSQQTCAQLQAQCTAEKQNGLLNRNGAYAAGNGPYCSAARAKGCAV